MAGVKNATISRGFFGGKSAAFPMTKTSKTGVKASNQYPLVKKHQKTILNMAQKIEIVDLHFDLPNLIGWWIFPYISFFCTVFCMFTRPGHILPQNKRQMIPPRSAKRQQLDVLILPG